MDPPPLKKFKDAGDDIEIQPLSYHEQAFRVSREREGISGNIAVAIKLLREGNTLPFIARYRRMQTGNIQEDDLRKIERELEIIDKVENKRKTVWKAAIKANADKATTKAIRQAYTTEELDALKESFSPSDGKKSKLQVAIEMGLQPLGEAIINDDFSTVQLLINSFSRDGANPEEIREGGIAIAAEIIFQNYNQDELVRLGRLIDLVSKVKSDKEEKYNTYHNFKRNVHAIKSYQYLAILRGEKEKALKISFAVQMGGSSYSASNRNECEDIDKLLDKVLLSQHPKKVQSYSGLKLRELPKSTEKQTAWKNARKRLRKMAERMWRRQLKHMAEEDAVTTFSENLHQKMLTPPLRYWINDVDHEKFGYCEDEQRVIALDPGFAHGTKVAVLKRSDGKVIDTHTLNMRRSDEAVAALKSILWSIENHEQDIKYDVIAVGNGHGSQQAIQIVKRAVGDKVSNIKNVIHVDETGASVYSATELAKSELPNMDINHRSAVSLARRVIDPLAELCKIDPESLGVGQYQHDIEKSVLGNELRKCVESCVAKVGVDLTTCSESLLKYVPGIGPAKAKKIIEYREGKLTEKAASKQKKKLRMLSKQDLCNVQGIGEKILKQAAGFVYISNAPKLVDRIAHIHPESLPIIEFMQKSFGGECIPELDLQNDLHVAKLTSFIENYREVLSKKSSSASSSKKTNGKKRALEVNEDIAKNTSTSIDDDDSITDSFNLELVKDIIRELRGEVEDIRKTHPFPLKIDLDTKQKTVEDVKAGDMFSGTVKNVVEFGAFVDINVGHDGLIHNSKLGGLNKKLKVNQVLKVKVLDKELRGSRYRIALAPV